MKMNTISNLSVLLLTVMLSACSRPKPETMDATIVEANIVQPGSNTDFRQNVGDSVYFEYDKHLLSEESKDTLTKQAAWLKTYPQYDITLAGHCDERGTVAYNLALGQRRADAAKAFLMAKGIESCRIVARSLGKEFPLSIGNDEAAWAKNRVTITLLKNKQGDLIEKNPGAVQAIGVIQSDGSVIGGQNLVSGTSTPAGL